MHSSAPHPHPHSRPPAHTGDLETDTAAAIEWLYARPELWLEDDLDPAVSSDGRTAA
jgi:hypothetical protein